MRVLRAYDVMARGNARQKIVRDDMDRRRLIDGLKRTVVRHGWESATVRRSGPNTRAREGTGRLVG